MLEAAHKGYDYQDLLVAIRLVDVLLSELSEVKVDEKLVDDDRFDDLTTISTTGYRERTQFKHKDASGQPLPLSTFTSEARDLRLDKLVASAVADRDGPGSGASSRLFRLVMRDTLPDDSRLIAVLRPRPASDPGAFTRGFQTTRLHLDLDSLWPIDPARQNTPEAQSFTAFRDGRLSRNDLAWFCDHFVVEINAPEASFDLTNPGAAELHLLDRLKSEVGAELYPNEGRTAIDVAQAIIGVARSARQRSVIVSHRVLLERTRLRYDFGAVSRLHPVDGNIEVRRGTAVATISAAIEEAAAQRHPLLLVGPPGQGKSWICKQVLESLKAGGWLLAEHYFYLGSIDSERNERVLEQAVFGSLLSRIAETDPQLVASQRPRYAADERAFVEAIRASLRSEPDRRIVIAIDGLDHVSRVQGVTTGQMDPSRRMAEILAQMDLPVGVALIILSQPGDHLTPLVNLGARIISAPALDNGELTRLAENLGFSFVDENETQLSDNTSELALRKNRQETFLGVLSERSAGNALYATYICREVLRSDALHLDPAAVVTSLPPFDSTLESYYKHLVTTLQDGGGVIADVLGLSDFSLTRRELRELFPELGHRVDAAIDHLAPVLSERSAQGGIRIYHESFARYLSRSIESDEIAKASMLERIASWLDRLGFTKDSRAFRFLLPTLLRGGKAHRVLELLRLEFAAEAIAAGFGAEAILANLAVGIAAASSLDDWSAIVRFTELAASARRCEDDCLPSVLVDFADVAVAVLGEDRYADRLLYDGRTTLPARAGLLLCDRVDRSGGAPPWPEYLKAFEVESAADNTHYGEESEARIAIAKLRGRLRAIPQGALRLKKIAKWMASTDLPAPDVIAAVLDTHGLDACTEAVASSGRSDLTLAMAELLYKRQGSEWLPKATALLASVEPGSLPAGSAFRLFDLKLDCASVCKLIGDYSRDRLLELTREVQNEGIQFRMDPLLLWLDFCATSAHLDRLGLATSEALIVGDGWYKCWLRFVVRMSDADAQSEHVSQKTIEAMRLLCDDLEPFSGNPRACDLFRIEPLIESSLRRAILNLDDSHWNEAVSILERVSRELGTTLSGEMGGPVPPDLLLELVILGTTTLARRSQSDQLLQATLVNGTSGRFYSDIASLHLWRARHLISLGDLSAASDAWRTASILLCCNGWRRDIAIYDLLDSVTFFAETQANSARDRLSKLQPLCLRVIQHTDGKDTKHAMARWWSLLAQIDPIAASILVSSSLLSESNIPQPALEDVRAHLWRDHHSKVDPVVGACLRLTIDSAIEPSDPKVIKTLACLTTEECPHVEHIGKLLVSRADERRSSYSYSNGAEHLTRDFELVAAINEACASTSIPSANPLPPSEREPERSPLAPRSPAKYELRKYIEEFSPERFGDGVIGLGKAIRRWVQRPYEPTGTSWDTDRFLNLIGYRIIGLAEIGLTEEATLAIWLLAENARFDRGADFLRDLARGLERHNHLDLAAVAFTLAWTRSRGSGGWLRFAGPSDASSLRSAARLNHEMMLSVIAEEVRLAVAGGGDDVRGITQSLVYVFSTIASIDVTPNSSEANQATTIWDAAFEVISFRLPRQHDSDDPSPRYSDSSTMSATNLDAALSLATVAGIAFPGREQKRRSFVATSNLLALRPNDVVDGITLALRVVSDTATITWLLETIERSPTVQLVAKHCSERLLALSTDPRLIVRTRARAILALASIPAPDMPTFDAAPELLVGQRGSKRGRGTDIIELLGRDRVKRGESFVPGFTAALVRAIEKRLAEDSYDNRGRRQIRTLSPGRNPEIPDAFLAPDEAFEECLQRILGSARTYLAQQGKLVTDHSGWEIRLAAAVSDAGPTQLALERTRIPRPLGLKTAKEIEATLEQTAKSAELDIAGGDVEMTVRSVLAVEGCPRSDHLNLRGWVIIASLERTIFVGEKWRNETGKMVISHGAIELRIDHDNRFFDSPPFAPQSYETWFSAGDGRSFGLSASQTAPLLGLDPEADSLAGSGLGWACPIISPTHILLEGLSLLPAATPFELNDAKGTAILLRHWRSGYTNDEYSLNRPRVTGTQVLMRPDVFSDLLSKVSSRVIWREYAGRLVSD